MNSIWLKIAGVAVVAVVVIIILGRLGGDERPPRAPADEPNTFEDMVERDRQFLAEPEPVEEPVAEAQGPAPVPSPSMEPAPQERTQETPRPPADGVVLPSEITQPTTMYFKPMGEIEEVEAQRILPVATAGRSIGRLPVTHFNLMVQGCRQILQKWPDSWYAFRAKQMLEEMPERFHRVYKVTRQELDVSRFLKARRGTQPRTVEPKR